MKKTLALLLVVIMAVSAFVFTGCGSKKGDSIEGTWEGQIDFGKLLGSAEEVAMFDLSDATIGMTFKFTKDQVTCELNTNDFEKIIDSMCNQLPALLKKQIADSTGMSFEDYLKAANLTEEQFMEQFQPQIDELRQELEASFDAESFSITESYEIKDGKIFCDGEESFLYKLSGDTLELDKPESVELEADNEQEESMLAAFEEMLPFVLKRAK